MAETARPFGSTTVCRAITRSSWIDKQNNTVLSAAFILEQDEPGLSVNYEPGCDRDFLNEIFSGCYGAAHLLIADLEALALDVIPDRQAGNEYHALVTGLPLPGPTPEQMALVERMAGILARKAATLTWPRAKKKGS
jgi:hypothetical protein